MKRYITGQDAHDPSPEEIAERCAEIQSAWSADVERKRRNKGDGRGLERWTAPEIAVDEICDA